MLLHVNSNLMPRHSRREPDEHALAAIEVLGLGHLKPRATRKAKAGLRYGWFAGRNRALSAVGVVEETQGPIAARLCADVVIARIEAGADVTTVQAAFIVREAARQLGEAR